MRFVVFIVLVVAVAACGSGAASVAGGAPSASPSYNDAATCSLFAYWSSSPVGLDPAQHVRWIEGLTQDDPHLTQLLDKYTDDDHFGASQQTVNNDLNAVEEYCGKQGYGPDASSSP